MLAISCATGSVEDLTLSVPFKSNAYVTPLDKSSKQTPAFADKIIANSYSDPQDAEMKEVAGRQSIMLSSLTASRSTSILLIVASCSWVFVQSRAQRASLNSML